MFPTPNPIRLVCWSANQSKVKRGIVRAVDGELCWMLIAMPIVCGRRSLNQFNSWQETSTQIKAWQWQIVVCTFPFATMDFVACAFPIWIPSVKCVGYGVSRKGLVVGVKCLFTDSTAPESSRPRDHEERPRPSLPESAQGLRGWGPIRCRQKDQGCVSGCYVEIIVWMRSFYRLIDHGIYNHHFCPQSFARTFQKTAERPSSWLTFCPVSR